jgi:hypothetical protein
LKNENWGSGSCVAREGRQDGKLSPFVHFAAEEGAEAAIWGVIVENLDDRRVIEAGGL